MENTIHENDISQQQILEELLKNSNKQLKYAKIRTFCSLVVAAIIILCTVMIVPNAINTINHANDVIEQASTTMTLADAAINSITEMSDSITEMGKNMDTFITDNSEIVTAVMGKMEAVDFEGLNKAIKDLGDVVQPLANFFNKFN